MGSVEIKPINAGFCSITPKYGLLVSGAKTRQTQAAN